MRLLFVLGMLAGVLLAPFIFIWALVKKARPFHFEGVAVRATVETAAHPAGERLLGPAIVRLSGGLESENSPARDVLGLALRLQRTTSDDLHMGDQDLLFATFESFSSLPRTIGSVKIEDYLANEYSSVTPWRVGGLGCVTLRLLPPHDAARAGADRVTRLLADIAAGTAVLALEARDGAERIPLARVRLTQRLASDGKALRASMWRNGRGYHPTGARNGIRAVVYPVSQAGRRLRNG
jgi:hypothetical protein